MQLLGGGFRQWLATLVLTLAVFGLPLSIWLFRTDMVQSVPDIAPSYVVPNYVVVFAVMFAEFVGALMGQLLGSKGLLNVQRAWNRNSLIAGAALAAGLINFFVYR